MGCRDVRRAEFLDSISEGNTLFKFPNLSHVLPFRPVSYPVTWRGGADDISHQLLLSVKVLSSFPANYSSMRFGSAYPVETQSNNEFLTI